VIAEIGGYVGGAFVLAAAVVLTGPRWGDFDTTQRIAILGVPAVILLAAAVAILITTPGGWPIHDRRGVGQRRRLSAALVLVGAALCGGIAVAGWDGSDRWDAVRFTVAALAVLAAGYASCRTLPLHVATAGVAAGLAGSAATAVVDNAQREELWAGLGLLGVAVGWLVLSLLGVLDEAALGLTVSGVIAFVGGEMISTQDHATWLGYLALGLLAVAGLVGYVRTRHVGVLVVGVVALATVVPQAVIHYTEGALGAAGALLLVGLSILGASVLGLRLRSGSR
jgi:hypothetical protein